MANPTTNLGMTKPTVGGSTDTWGTTLNENVVDIIDALFSISGTDVTMSDIKFNSVGLQETGAGTDTVKIQAPAAVTQYTLTMPGAVGASGQILRTSDASGTLAWVTDEEGDLKSVADATNGGMTVTNGTGPDVTLALNFNDLSAAAVNVANDSIAIIDADDSSTKKESIADLATAMGGTGLTGASGTLAVDASQTQITSVGALGAGSITSGFGAIDVGSSSIDGGTITGTFSGNITGNVTGNCSGSAGSATGNAATATALATARAINGTDFDGTAAITVTAAAGTLTGATLAGGVTASSLTSLGTIGSLVATTADINGGTIDGTTIGASTPSTAAVTTAYVSKDTTVSRTAVIRPVTVETTASGSAANPYAGFGTGIEFRMTDYAGYLEPAGAIDCVMDGSDNTTPPDSGFTSGLVFSTVPLQSSGITNQMWLTGAGKLGVGLSAPVRPLQVALADTEMVHFGGLNTNESGEYCGIGLGQIDASGDYNKVCLVYEGNGSGSYFGKFHVLSSSTAGSGNATLSNIAFTIDNLQNTVIPATKKLYLDGAAGVGGGTYIAETSGNTIGIVSDNNENLQVKVAGVAVAAGKSLFLDGGTHTYLEEYDDNKIEIVANGVRQIDIMVDETIFTQAATFEGSVSKASGSFKIDHPLPNKKDTHHLVHSFHEGPRADLWYRGEIALVSGSATVDLDEAAGMSGGTWDLLCRDPQVWIQNDTGWDAVRGSVSGSTLTIECSNATSSDTVSWMVVAERCDQHMIDTAWTDSEGRVIVEPEKAPVV